MPDFELHADFDRDGRLTGTPSEYGLRLRAPGAVVVANLDADRRRLPDRVDAGPEITLDSAQPTKSAADDEVIPLRVRIVNPAAAAGAQFALRLSGIQSVRTSLFDEQGRILPNGPSLPREHPITLPAAPQLDLLLETRTYPGSPYGHATLFNTRFRPDPDDESRFEVELLSRDAARRETVHDRATFSVAPVLFLDNGVRAVRLYICEVPDNEPSVSDVRTALAAIPGVELVIVPADVAQGDTWLQDQFQPGIVVGADGWRHAIIHLPRMRSNFVQTQGGQNLARFVRSHFPSRNVGVMNDFWQRHLVFSDATGQRRDLQLRDCITLADRMQKVSALLGHYNRLLSRLDRAWKPVTGLSWSEARVTLPQLLIVLGKTIRAARTGASTEWSATLDAMLRDSTERLRQVEQDLPVSGDRFRLPLTSGSMEVEGRRADELFARIHQFRDSSNYGGNIEVAPPTAGAPLGTIVIGNARVGDRDFMDPDLLRFLHKQRKQPIVEVDTTWLDVGHVDELLTFVPDRNGAGQRFAALRASAGLALKLIQAAAARYRGGLPMEHPHRLDHTPSGVLERLTRAGSAPVTRLLRGKVWSHSHRPPSGPGDTPDVLEPPRIYQDLARALNGGDPSAPSSGGFNIHDIRFWPGEGPDRAYPADITVLELLFAESDDRGESVNELIETQFLEPLHDQVTEAFSGARVFPLPVLFDRVPNVQAWQEDPLKFFTSAFTPNVVNMQVLNGHLLIPRPYGPRMRAADAIAVLTEVLREVPPAENLARQLNPRFFQRHGLGSTVCWIRRQEAVYRTVSASGLIRSVFGGIRTLGDIVKLFKDGFPGLSDSVIEARILQDNRRHFTANGELRNGWRRFVIREDMVDLFEAYIQLVVNSLGLTVHWVDSWFYHTHFGEIHCGTNVLRVPERGQIPNWWDVPDVPDVPDVEVMDIEE